MIHEEAVLAGYVSWRRPYENIAFSDVPCMPWKTLRAHPTKATTVLLKRDKNPDGRVFMIQRLNGELLNLRVAGGISRR